MSKELASVAGTLPGTGLTAFIERNRFILRRAHSLSGIVPLGAFLLEHFFTNATAIYGDAQRSRIYDGKVAALNELPLVALIECFVIWLPLLYHAVFGIYLAWEGKNNPDKYPLYRNLLFIFQRITGVLVFAFLIYHVGHWRFGLFGKSVPYWEFYHEFMVAMQNSLQYWLYVVAVVLVSYHFANGLWTFCMTWGLVRSSSAQQRLLPVVVMIFLGLSYISTNTLYHFRSQGHGIKLFYREELEPQVSPVVGGGSLLAPSSVAPVSSH